MIVILTISFIPLQSNRFMCWKAKSTIHEQTENNQLQHQQKTSSITPQLQQVEKNKARENFQIRTFESARSALRDFVGFFFSVVGSLVIFTQDIACKYTFVGGRLEGRSI